MGMAAICRTESHRVATILVVDDEPCFREVVADILTADGYRIHSACNVSEAFSAIQLEKPWLILTDQMMPEIDGLAFVERLRANPQWADIRVIVVSAKAQDEDIHRAMQAGADDYLVKPFSASELRAKLQRCPRRAG